ncbi:MAG: type IV secretion system DNA-binding domain-containing protein [Anaerolineales bacterium]|nr:type IV secretion system DNA-binding domain-containing protein [Anaerolineales bacterium]
MAKKNIEVFEGHELRDNPPEFSSEYPRCLLIGNGANNQETKISLNDELFSKHILFLGGIGTGKTNAIFQIMEQLRKNMTQNDVMLVFDTKGDYYNEFYRKGDIVFSNDEKATGAGGEDYWNIFKEVGLEESIEESIFEITRALFYEKIEHSTQPFFPNAAKDIFSAILLHFFRSNGPSKTNNAQIRTFLDQSPSSEIRAMLESHLDLRAMISYISDDRSPQTQGVISELQQLAREILIGNFRKAGNLSIREAIRNKGGRVIFVEYDLGLGNILTPIYRLILDLAIKEALCRKKSEGNVWFIIDEFRLVPNLQHVDDGVNFGRSLGAKFIIGVQSVEQVFHAYGEALARSMLSGFMTTVAFRVNDSATRTFVQQLFGKNRKRETYMATVASRGLVEQVREANVVEDWDINSLSIGKAIIGLPSQEPFLFHFKKYDKS